MSTETALILLLISRLPIYLYVLWRAFQFRNSLILISAKYLGLMATTGAMGAISNVYGNRALTNIIGTLFSLSLFCVAFTAKELKKVKE